MGGFRGITRRSNHWDGRRPSERKVKPWPCVYQAHEQGAQRAAKKGRNSWSAWECPGTMGRNGEKQKSICESWWEAATGTSSWWWLILWVWFALPMMLLTYLLKIHAQPGLSDAPRSQCPCIWELNSGCSLYCDASGSPPGGWDRGTNSNPRI